MVDGLEKDYEDKLSFEVVSTTAEGAQDRIQAYGLEIHGMVITDGEDQVLWKESGHKQTRDRTVAAIEQVLGG